MRRTALSILLSWCIALTGFVPPARAQGERTYTLAVLNLFANGISDSEARSLSDFLRGSITEAVASERYRKLPKAVYSRTLERSQMDKIFDQFNTQNTGCVSDSCAVELGKMLGVERIVIGSVGLVGRTYTVQARIVDVGSTEIVASSTYTFRGERDVLIEKGVPTIVSELLYGKRPAIPVGGPPPVDLRKDKTDQQGITTGQASILLEGGLRFANDEAKSGLLGAVGMLNKISPSVFLGGSIGIAHFDNKVKTISKGNVTLFPLMARIVLRDAGGLSFGGSVGYVFANHSIDSEVESALASIGFKVEEKVRGAFSAELAIGYTAVTGPKLSRGVFVGDQFHKPKVEVTVTELSSGASATGEDKDALSAPFVRAFLSF